MYQEREHTSPPQRCLESQIERQRSQHFQRQKVIETYELEAYRIATTNTLQQSELEPDDVSDDFEDFDEDMEVFVPKVVVDIDIPPW